MIMSFRSTRGHVRTLCAEVMLAVMAMAVLCLPLKAFAKSNVRTASPTIFHHWPH